MNHIKDNLFKENHQGISQYWDFNGVHHQGHQTAGLVVQIQHHKNKLNPYNVKLNLEGKQTTFKSRDELLDHEIATRLNISKNFLDSNPYIGFKLTPFQKIKCLLGLNIDHELQDQIKPALMANYSLKNVENMTNYIHPSQKIRTQLSIEKHQTYKLATKTSWAFNSSFNGYSFIDEKGIKVDIQNGITSSSDRLSPFISMQRRIDDLETGETIAYTGRPDTMEKALEQITFMFRSAYQKKDLKKGDDDFYTLTYVVNNLLSPITGIGLATFDEKQSTLNEALVFEKLSNKELEIEGHRVRVRPLYFSQPFNNTNDLARIITDAHSGKGLSKKLNTKGYATLIPLAEKHLENMSHSKQKELLKGAIRELKSHPSSLLPEEELFNRSIICQILGLSLVLHCKSSTDRTTLALATTLVAHQWRKLKLDWIHNKEGNVRPHLILQHEAAKELIAGHCLAGHQITRISRTFEGVVKEHTMKTRTFGFKWHSNPIAGRLLPDRYTKASNIALLKQIGVGILSTFGFLINLALALFIWLIGTIINRNPFFNPIYLKPGISPFANHLINPLSPYVGREEGRNLLHPKPMVAS